MPLPRKKSRGISVAGIAYRWLKGAADARIDLRVELDENPASQLVVGVEPDANGQLPEVGPGLVAALIERAIGEGWAPGESDPNEFRLGQVDDLVARHDLRARKALACLIIAPFDSGASRLRNTLARAVRELGVQVREASDAVGSESTAAAITTWIAEVDLIVADVSRKNPAVLYQLGYAHALGKSTVLLLDDTVDSAPAVLDGHLFVTYSAHELKALQGSVQRALLRAIRARAGR